LDENVDPDVALALRRQGIDVRATREMGLLGQPDEVKLAFACEQGLAIVTHNPDLT
jgi:predicted nuclease of predicted toxin-antitoxin system